MRMREISLGPLHSEQATAMVMLPGSQLLTVYCARVRHPARVYVITWEVIYWPTEHVQKYENQLEKGERRRRSNFFLLRIPMPYACTLYGGWR